MTTQYCILYFLYTSHHPPIHTHIYRLAAEATMQGATCSSGAITSYNEKVHPQQIRVQYVAQRHGDCRGQELNQQPSDWRTTIVPVLQYYVLWEATRC